MFFKIHALLLLSWSPILVWGRFVRATRDEPIVGTVGRNGIIRAHFSGFASPVFGNTQVTRRLQRSETGMRLRHGLDILYPEKRCLMLLPCAFALNSVRTAEDCWTYTTDYHGEQEPHIHG